ncbi:RHS repeat-associated core domain-containing protein [Clostridium aciditolerans]|uniref:Teneurin-like YD-shell domain-containing protein n=1 Tax=Clostridium aciditolerans TaxID=339861 RepID=A0A934M3P3_9CLOT|nr:hypothetical protein [Clostridium aciditolerans]
MPKTYLTDKGVRTEKNVNRVVTKYHLNGIEYYYIRNAQGDIIGLFDTNGNDVVSYTYDTWGKLISIDGSLKDTVGVKNPYKYRGYRYDTETGLYYLNARYYNPELGRFINADSLGGKVGELLSHNVFAYCTNNPVNLDDPSGCSSFWGKIWESTKMIASKVAEAVKKVTQFITPSTSTKAAGLIATVIVSYKFVKPQKVSAKGELKLKTFQGEVITMKFMLINL